MSYKPTSSSVEKRDSEAYKYFTEAEQKLNAKGGWFRSMIGLDDESKYEDAAQLFVKAANTYKLGKSWKRAGEAYVRAAETLEMTSNGKYDAASKYSDAAKVFKNGHLTQAIKALESANGHFETLGRFQQCAKINKEIAEIHETNEDLEKAIHYFTVAADFYDGEDSKSSANACRVKVAELSALTEKYAAAIELYQNAASTALESNLLKFGAKDYLLRAGMCYLCLGDDVGANRAVERFKEMDPTFSDSRESKLLEGIIDAVEKGDVEAFTTAAYEFDSIARLDPWKTKILLRIKTGLRSNEEDLT